MKKEKNIIKYIDMIETENNFLYDLGYLLDHIDTEEVLNNEKLKSIILSFLFYHVGAIGDNIEKLYKLIGEKPCYTDK